MLNVLIFLVYSLLTIFASACLAEYAVNKNIKKIEENIKNIIEVGKCHH